MYSVLANVITSLDIVGDVSPSVVVVIGTPPLPLGVNADIYAPPSTIRTSARGRSDTAYTLAPAAISRANASLGARG